MNLLKRKNCLIQNVSQLNFTVMSFDFKNNKRLIIKIGIERIIEKKMEIPKEKNQIKNKINYNKKNVIFKFK